jgi:hypothetical protein
MALSDAQADRRPFRRRSETRPPPVLDLPQLPGSPFLHALLTTPVDQLRCARRLLSSLGHTAFPVMQTGRPPQLTFEACSSFTHVTACRIAHPPFVGFITRLRPAPVSRLRTLASYQVLPTTAWMGPSPTGIPRLWGALHRILCTDLQEVTDTAIVSGSRIFIGSRKEFCKAAMGAGFVLAARFQGNHAGRSRMSSWAVNSRRIQNEVHNSGVTVPGVE